MTAHEVLVKARNLLERDGWCVYSLGGPGEPRCGLGAIRDGGAQADTPLADVVAQEVLAAAGKEVSVASARGHLMCWNDGVTEEEVLAAFDKAISVTAPPPEDPFKSTDNLPEFLQKETV